MSMLALAMTSAGLRAEDAGDDHPRKDDRGKAEWQAKAFGRMKDKLGLSDDQAAKLKDAFEAHKKAVKPLRRDLKVSLEKLRWQVDAKADAKDLAATLDQIKSSRAALREAHEKLASRLSGILTPEQRARMALWRFDMMKRRRGMVFMRRGGPGMPPPPPGMDGRRFGPPTGPDRAGPDDDGHDREDGPAQE